MRMLRGCLRRPPCLSRVNRNKLRAETLQVAPLMSSPGQEWGDGPTTPEHPAAKIALAIVSGDFGQAAEILSTLSESFFGELVHAEWPEPGDEEEEAGDEDEDESGMTLLHLLAASASMASSSKVAVDIARTLLEHGADLAARNRTGATPVHVAAGAGHP